MANKIKIYIQADSENDFKRLQKKVKEFESQYSLLGNGEAVAKYGPSTKPPTGIKVSIIPQGIGSKIESICCNDPTETLAGLVKSEEGLIMLDFGGYRYLIANLPDKS